MRLYREETVWSGGGTNHWYLLDDARRQMFGYRKFGQGEVTLFNKPLPFYDKGRKLILEHDFGDVDNDVIHVQGSTGEVYTVRLGEKPSCTCKAFQYRSYCKHIQQAQ